MTTAMTLAAAQETSWPGAVMFLGAAAAGAFTLWLIFRR